MGVPYSKEITLALGHVAPLAQKIQLAVLLVVAIQILIVALLSAIFLAIIALIICVTPELSRERGLLVATPLKWLTQIFISSPNRQPKPHLEQPVRGKSRRD